MVFLKVQQSPSSIFTHVLLRLLSMRWEVKRPLSWRLTCHSDDASPHRQTRKKKGKEAPWVIYDRAVLGFMRNLAQWCAYLVVITAINSHRFNILPGCASKNHKLFFFLHLFFEHLKHLNPNRITWISDNKMFFFNHYWWLNVEFSKE